MLGGETCHVNQVKGLSRDRLMGRHSEEMAGSKACRKRYLEKELQSLLKKVSQGRGRQDKSPETFMCLVFLGTLQLEQSEVEAGQSRLNKPCQPRPYR